MKIDARYKKILENSCSICGKQLKLGDEIEVSNTRRRGIICVHTKCWEDEQAFFKWQRENRMEAI